MKSTKTAKCKHEVNETTKTVRTKENGVNNTRRTSESESGKQTNDTQNANRKRQLKECSKPNLKSERNWRSNWNYDIMTHATVKDKAKQLGLVNENEARRYHKSLILTWERYYVGWEVPTDVICGQILSNFFQNSLARREGDTTSIGSFQLT